MFDTVDDTMPLDVPESTNAMVSALTTSYAHATTHIAEFSKLQYQLVAIAYGLAGAAIAFFGNQLGQSGTQFQGTFLLFLPPIFFAIAFVQIYLHTQIKRYGRYVEYDLRPKMEAIIEADLGLNENSHLSFWDWETVYIKDIVPSKLARFHTWIVRILSLLIMVLPLIPAIAAIGIYEIIDSNRAFTTFENVFRIINLTTLIVTISLIGIIGWVNLFELDKQARRKGEQDKQTYLHILRSRRKNIGSSSDEDMAIETYLEIQTDPTMIALEVLLSNNPANRKKLLSRLTQIVKAKKRKK